MPKIKYRPSGFPPGSPSNLLKTQDLDITLAEFIWGCITVGKFGLLDLTYFGVKSFHEIFFKWHLLFANLDITKGRFSKTFLYENLDPTEKAVVSYYLGMTCAKVFADRRLNTPWLYHVSKINLLTITFHPGDSRPDLIGDDINGNWIVVEAKGRTNRCCSKTMLAAKKQTLQINKINGKLPIFRVAFQSYFNKYLELAVNDPPEPDRNAKNLNFDEAFAIRQYYEYLVNILIDSNASRDTKHGSIRIIEFKEIGLTVGLLESIIGAWHSDVSLTEARDTLRSKVYETGNTDSFSSNQKTYEQFFRDGVYISISESTWRMK